MGLRRFELRLGGPEPPVILLPSNAAIRSITTSKLHYSPKVNNLKREIMHLKDFSIRGNHRGILQPHLRHDRIGFASARYAALCSR